MFVCVCFPANTLKEPTLPLRESGDQILQTAAHELGDDLLGGKFLKRTVWFQFAVFCCCGVRAFAVYGYAVCSFDFALLQFYSF